MSRVARSARVASRQRVETISADKTIVTAETGELYLVDGSGLGGSMTITLPSPQDGAYFTFLLKANSAAQKIFIDSGAGNTINGRLQQGSTDADMVDHSNQKLGFGASAKRGSCVELVSDGSAWYVIQAESDVAFVIS